MERGFSEELITNKLQVLCISDETPNTKASVPLCV